MRRPIFRETIGHTMRFKGRVEHWEHCYRWRVCGTFRSALFRSRRDPDRFAVLHRTTRPDDDGPWRVSYFDQLGAIGHCARDTPEQALKDSDITYGYRLERVAP
jgi:hypothetical protein